jgi:hypothetical protein
MQPAHVFAVVVSVTFAVAAIVHFNHARVLRLRFEEKVLNDAEDPPLFAAPTADPVYIPRNLFAFTTPGTKQTLPFRITARANPSFKPRVFDEHAARKYMMRHCPESLSDYDAFVPISFKADVWRYCALWAEGGVYTDDDLVVLKPLEDIAAAARHNITAVWDRKMKGERGVITGFMVAVKGDPTFKCALEQIKKHVAEKKMNFETGSPTLKITGPQLLYLCLRNHTSIVFKWKVLAAKPSSDLGYPAVDITTHERLYYHISEPRLHTQPHYSDLYNNGLVYNK